VLGLAAGFGRGHGHAHTNGHERASRRTPASGAPAEPVDKAAG
jgi:hypothetical protein